MELYATGFKTSMDVYIWIYLYTINERGLINNLQRGRRHICLRQWNFSFISSHPPRLSDLSSRPFPFPLLVLVRFPMSSAKPARRKLGSLRFRHEVGRIRHEKNMIWTRSCGRGEEPVLEKGQVAKIGLEQVIEKVTDQRYNTNDTVD